MNEDDSKQVEVVSESRYRVSSAVSLTFNPWGGFTASLGQTRRNRRELGADQVELLWLFGTGRTVAEALQILDSSSVEEPEREIDALVAAEFLVEADCGCPHDRFLAFRAAVDEWLGARVGLFPLSSPLPHQNPGIYYPGLTSLEFHDPARFGWLQALDWDAFRREARGLVRSRQGFKTVHRGFTGTGAWAGAYLWVHGRPVEETCSLCPRLAEFLASTPGATEFGTAFLSALSAGSHVTPHCGSTNAKLRVQLPIVVPESCYLRVGQQELQLQPETPIVFDDSFLHTAWNHSTRSRIVLVFDFFHPDLSHAEIEYLLEVSPSLDPSSRYTDPLAGEVFPEWLDPGDLEN